MPGGPRGPGRQGHAEAQGLPLRWSETRNVTWKVPIPGQGWSSPVIEGDQIWMTTATEKGSSLRAVCVDRVGGRVLHNVEVFRQEDPLKIEVTFKQAIHVVGTYFPALGVASLRPAPAA